MPLKDSREINECHSLLFPEPVRTRRLIRDAVPPIAVTGILNPQLTDHTETALLAATDDLAERRSNNWLAVV